MKSSNSPKRIKRGGFALILAIAAMAFMVLLTLTLSSVITSKLRLLSAQKEMRSARSNAILGLSVAISELQSKLGKDNAISFSSSVFDEDPETVEIENVQSPYVTGVISLETENSRLTPKELQDEQRILMDKIRKGGSDTNVSWLVSGSKMMRNPKIENIEDLSDETVNIAEFKTLTAYPGSFGGQVTAQYKSNRVQVKAGKIQFSTQNDNNQDGAYAWWVSDESLKAKINLTRPDKYLEEDMGEINSSRAYADSKIPQVSNLSFVAELTDYDSNPFAKGFKEETAQIYKKMTTLNELAIVDTSLEDWAKYNKNDWTASSIGIPVDVTQGRLKEDLTQYLAGDHGLRAQDPIIRGIQNDNDYTGVDFEFNGKTELLPLFGHMKSWYDFTEGDPKNFSDGVTPKAPNMTSGNPQHGLAPIIGMVRLAFFPVYDLMDGSPDLYDFKNVEFKVSLAIMPEISIWNPHNVKLEQADYEILIYMPYEFCMGLSTSFNRTSFEACTSWVREFDGDSDIVRFKYIQQGTCYADFARIFGNNFRADNGSPFMRFKVRNLELRPGESVQLVPSLENGKMPDYKTGTADENLLVPGTIARDRNVSTFPLNVNSGYAFKVKLGRNNTDLKFKYNGFTVGDMNSNAHMASNTDITEEVSNNLIRPSASDYFLKSQMPEHLGNKECIYTPFSQRAQKYIVADAIADSDSWKQPVIQTQWIVRLANGPAGLIPTFYPRYGHELFLDNGVDGKQRVEQVDLTEWESFGTPSSRNTAESGVTWDYKQRQNFICFAIKYFQQPMIIGTNKHHGISLEGAESFALTPASDFRDTNFSQNDIKNGKFIYLVNGSSGTKSLKGANVENLMVRQTSPVGGTRTARAYRAPGMALMENLPFSGENQRGSHVKDSSQVRINAMNPNSSAVIKRPVSQTGSLRTYGSVKKFTEDKAMAPLFGSNYSGWAETRILAGMFAYPPDEPRSSGMLNTDDLMTAYRSGTSDGYSERYGNTSLLSTSGSYGLDHVISAPFEIPRSEFDFLSLGVFSHMNFTQYSWMPSWQFGESYASPFMKREDVVESEYAALNPNAVELFDISFVLNASMWDRFYLSTMIPKHMPNTPTAGMRLPNTRYFIKSVPQDKSYLFGSDEAFKRSAAYVAIDGPFNINSTSYEAWRAFLGGMLGTKKKTLTNQYINEDGNNPNDPESFKMPNPGSMNALALPVGEDSSAEPNNYYTYKDLIIGRSISEPEIDQLAREIVAEVKRRAPFFSLSDFVNRRLIKYSEASGDLDLSYQSLMGTIAAAISRAVQDTNRPNYFFNSERFADGDLNSVDAGSSKKDKFVRKATEITSNLGVTNNGNDYMQLGERTRENSAEFLEHAARAPRMEGVISGRMDAAPGMLKQRDILNMIGPFITVRGDTFTVRAYGESKNPMTGTTSKAYCEAIVQRSSEPVEGNDDIVAPASPFGRRFNIVSFRWLTPAEL